ncbi:hypothetical protein, partial [Burkholderia ubonensis]|uniref:hypothetical protein n=1 Tax=Burkholderia ubonensis TaxID=101571 RepID=UPI001E418F94
LRLGAGIMPGLAGQNPDYRGVKIVTRGGFDARIRPPDVAIPAAGMPDDGASRPKKLSRRNVSRLPFSQV